MAKVKSTRARDTGGNITLRQLADRHKMNPKTARRKLRKAFGSDHERGASWVFKPNSTMLKRAVNVLTAE